MILRRVNLMLAACVAIVVLGFVPGSAAASVTIGSFNAGPSVSEAGGHPDFLIEYGLSSRQTEPTPCACDDAKDITVHLPPGFIANPHATPQCGVAAFAADQCPVDSQVGAVMAELAFSAEVATGHGFLFVSPLFNLNPPPGEAGLLGFKSAGLDSPTFEVVSPRTNTDYGLDVATKSIEHFGPLVGFEQVTWGVPAAPVHDYLRFGLGQPPPLYLNFGGQQPPVFCDQNGEPSTDEPTTVFQLCPDANQGPHPAGAGNKGPGGPVASQSPEVPFTQNPTTCGTSTLETSMDVLAYDGGETHAHAPWPPTTDCTQLSFNPSQAIEPTTTAADSPSGAEALLTVPQFESPSVPSPSELRTAKIALPEGFSLAPNVTNGKVTCTEAEAETGPFATTEEGHCPEDSKIGSITVETPVLPGPLSGAAYLGEPRPGQRFRVFLLFDGYGVHIKVAGIVHTNPVTGQIQLEFSNLPQAPFAAFNLHIFGSERGPLDTPTRCGTYEVTSEWTPWDSALSNQTSRQFFEITEGPNGTPCPNGPRPFHPSLQAASTANSGGHHTDFWLNLLREDGEQNLAGLSVTTPPGFAATLKGLTYCPDSAIVSAALESHLGAEEQASPSCPASSLVGELTTGSGPGTHPLYLPGKAYLAGPYKGAPLSFVFITPAVSAGYDLGNVVIRAAVRVNPETAQVTTVSDPLPQIFQGILLRLRQVFVDLNRPDFALNPTNCEPLAVTSQITGDEGAISNASDHFQVANCAALPFEPTLAMSLTGSVKHAGYPGVKAVLTYPRGGSYANVAKTSVTLPPTELIANAHINQPCTKAVFSSTQAPGEKCPPGSVIGFAKAETPLLDESLEGPVYLRSAPENKSGLPDLVAALNGQIDIVLDGKITTVKGNRLRTTFAAVPDAPVSRFTLSLYAGHKSLLETSAESLCARPLHVGAEITGQNGKTANQNPLLKVPCHRKHMRSHKHHKRARVHISSRSNPMGEVR